MIGNVMSWKEAIKKGYEPRLYPFVFDRVPIGEFTAQLDFKIWAKKILAVSCYFTESETGTKFQLTVYCSKTGIYKVSEVNFVSCPLLRVYRIRTVAGQKKTIKLAAVLLIEP